MTPEQLAAMEKEADDLLAAQQGTSEQSAEASTSPADVAPTNQAVTDDGAALGVTAESPSDQESRGVSDAPVTATDTAPADATPPSPTVPVEQYDHAVRRMHQATTEAAELRRRNADLESRVQALEAPAAETQQPTTPHPSTAPSQPQEGKLPELNELDDLYPEIAEVLKPIVARLQSDVAQAKVRFERMDETEAEASARRHAEAIQSAHPDAYAIAQSPAFSDWIAQQPPLFQQAVRQGSAADVVFVLDHYKAQSPKPPAAPVTPTVADARRAATPSVPRTPTATPTQPRFTHQQIASMSLAEYAQNEKAIDQALAAGLVM